MYICKEDYTEPYTDGSGRYKTIAKKGQQISWATAVALGLVQGDEPKEEPNPTKAQKEETQVKR